MSEQKNEMTIMVRPNELIVFLQGIKKCITFPRKHKDFDYIYNYVVQEDATEEGFLDRFITIATEAIEKYSQGHITANDHGIANIDGLELPSDVLAKIKELRNAGYSWESHQKFWARCLLNPRRESVSDLFRFISKYNLTITTDGKFIAYKAITRNFKDKYTGTIDNYPGCVVTMRREDVAFDPERACSAGLHVANLRYAKSYALEDDHIVLVEVDPSDVVSVPYDSDAEKIRCCKYKVLRLWDRVGDGELATGVVRSEDDGKLSTVQTVQEKRADNPEQYGIRTAWSDIEDTLLLTAVQHKGEVWDAIAALLANRSAEDCEKRYKELGATKNTVDHLQVKDDGERKGKTSFWTLEQDNKLKAMYNQGRTYKDIGKALGKTAESVRHRVRRLRKEWRC